MVDLSERDRTFREWWISPGGTLNARCATSKQSGPPVFDAGGLAKLNPALNRP
jgi:hypothetical protein